MPATMCGVSSATWTMPATGIPSEEDYVAAYCERTGLGGIPDWTFYLAFSLFRLAAISQGVYKRGLDGNASSPDAVERGAKARQLDGDRLGDCAAGVSAGPSDNPLLPQSARRFRHRRRNVRPAPLPLCSLSVGGRRMSGGRVR